jgi:hypothetical protein
MSRKDEVALAESIETLFEHAQKVLQDAGLDADDAESLVDDFEKAVTEAFED